MANFISVLTSFILLCNGIQLFREPTDVGGGPLISSYVFMFASFLLLYDLGIYPKSLRTLGRIGQSVLEFFISSFLMENIMIDFWFPLEVGMMALPAKAADLTEEMLQTGEWSCEYFCDFLRDDNTGLITSYMLSTFFLIAVLHAIRAIDLRALQEGPGCFFGDIIFRLKRFTRKKIKSIGFGSKKRVKITEIGKRSIRRGKNRGHPRNKNSCMDDLEDYRGDDSSSGKISDFDMAMDDL